MLLDISEIRRNQNIIINLSTYAKHVLNQHTLFRVHSIFDSGFNLVSPQGLILYCTSKKLSKNVLVLQFESENFNNLKRQLQIDTLVKITEQRVTFYTTPIIRYTVDYCLSYSSEQIGVLSNDDLRLFRNENLTVLKSLEKQLLERSGFEQSLIQPIQKISYPNPYLLSFEDLKWLNGQGTGLTPTGDDFIVGYTILEKALSTRNIDDLLMCFIEKNDTSDITLSSYRALKDNQFDNIWQKIIESIACHDYIQFSRHIAVALQKGATSGHDQVLGLLHRILYTEEYYG